MNCVIGADKIQCGLLEEFISKSSSLNLVGTFSDCASIRNQLSKGHNIDLFFLDIDIPELDLFNFVNSLNFLPNTILLSVNVKDAIKAFDINVVDYLLKPVTYPRFFRAIDKANKFYLHKETKNAIENEIFIKKGSSLVKLRLSDLVYIEAQENYITLHTEEAKFTIHFTLKAIEDQLSSGVFLRVHRSFIINKNFIQAVREDSLDLIRGNKLETIPIGNSFREKLMNNITTIVR
jgi:DNA-binding LytR/AlgR family response regulator